VSVKVLLAVMLLTVNEPLTVTAPMPLSSEADVAFEEVHVSVLAPPDCTDVGLAVSVQTGACGTGVTTIDV